MFARSITAPIRKPIQPKVTAPLEKTQFSQNYYCPSAKLIAPARTTHKPVSFEKSGGSGDISSIDAISMNDEISLTIL